MAKIDLAEEAGNRRYCRRAPSTANRLGRAIVGFEPSDVLK